MHHIRANLDLVFGRFPVDSFVGVEAVNLCVHLASPVVGHTQYTLLCAKVFARAVVLMETADRTNCGTITPTHSGLTGLGLRIVAGSPLVAHLHSESSHIRRRNASSDAQRNVRIRVRGLLAPVVIVGRTAVSTVSKDEFGHSSDIITAGIHGYMPTSRCSTAQRHLPLLYIRVHSSLIS